jgi:hypothetical protein
MAKPGISGELISVYVEDTRAILVTTLDGEFLTPGRLLKNPSS